MITEGDAAILLKTTRRAFGNQEKSKQRSAIVALNLNLIEVISDHNKELRSSNLYYDIQTEMT